MSKTAVEWLVKEIEEKHNFRFGNFYWAEITQAIAMEREQRFKDFQGGFQAATDAIIGANKSVQSKTYGKEASDE